MPESRKSWRFERTPMSDRGSRSAAFRGRRGHSSTRSGSATTFTSNRDALPSAGSPPKLHLVRELEAHHLFEGDVQLDPVFAGRLDRGVDRSVAAEAFGV